MTNTHIHSRHPALVAALRRSNGQRQSIINMMENSRLRAGMTQQLKEAKKAVTDAKRALIRDHKNYCLDAEISPAYIEELKPIARDL